MDPDKQETPLPVPEEAAPPSALDRFLAAHHVSKDSFLRLLWVLATVLLCALAAVGATLYRKSSVRRADRVCRELADAATSSDLKKLLEKRGAGPVEALILLKLGRVQFTEGNLAEAAETAEKFLARHAKHPLAPIVELQRVFCAEGRAGGAADALKQYEEFCARHKGTYLEPEAVFGRIRCLMVLGRHEEARRAAEDYLAANPATPWKKRLESALDQADTETRRRQGNL